MVSLKPFPQLSPFGEGQQVLDIHALYFDLIRKLVEYLRFMAAPQHSENKFSLYSRLAH